MGYILKVPHIERTAEWPSGDECLCAVMLLRYLGIRITMEEFIDFLANPFGQITLFIGTAFLLYYLSKHGFFKHESTDTKKEEEQWERNNEDSF